MDKFISTGIGGLPLTLNDIRYFLGQLSNQGIYQALNAMLRGFGTDFIIEGVAESGGNVTEGFILLNGEILRVDAHDRGTDTHFAKVVSTNPLGDKTFLNGSPQETYQENRAVVNTTSGALRFDGDRIENIIDNRARIKDNSLLISLDTSPEVSIMVNILVANFRLTDIMKITLPNPISYLTIIKSSATERQIRIIEPSADTPNGWKMCVAMIPTAKFGISNESTLVGATTFPSNLNLMLGVDPDGNSTINPRVGGLGVPPFGTGFIPNFFWADPVQGSPDSVAYDKKIFIEFVWNKIENVWYEKSRSGFSNF